MNRNHKSGLRKLLEPKNFILTENVSFSVQEAYKSLRTNIMFALPGNECKCIGVTSPVSGDGKSTTSVNLAMSLAQIGKRVLLIDCDMRLPTIALKLGIRQTPGLSDFLIGEVRIDEAICNVEKYGIHVLPASNLPADPTGLLESKQMEHLFVALRRNYEFVIVDLPPVSVVSDALIISKCLDGFLLTVRQKKTAHRSVAESLRLMQFADAKVLGVVVTGGSIGGKQYDRYHSKYYKQRWQKVVER